MIKAKHYIKYIKISLIKKTNNRVSDTNYKTSNDVYSKINNDTNSNRANNIASSIASSKANDKTNKKTNDKVSNNKNLKNKSILLKF